jgi:hypothetical protein
MELTNWIPILIFPIIKYIGNFGKEIKRKEEEKHYFHTYSPLAFIFYRDSLTKKVFEIIILNCSVWSANMFKFLKLRFLKQQILLYKKDIPRFVDFSNLTLANL